jgi:hypothetical protein
MSARKSPPIMTNPVSRRIGKDANGSSDSNTVPVGPGRTLVLAKDSIPVFDRDVPRLADTPDIPHR